ncbi:MAG: glycoside hydrolase family 2 TIM barrel-domain containing protein [Coraliomargaritaceae bacterium]
MTACQAKTDSVVIVQEGLKNFRLEVEGKSYFANGVGGSENLELLKKLGGNTIRTWGIDQLDSKIDGMPLLDYAHKLGLKVVAGIWVEHERHGFDYTDRAQVKEQRKNIRAAVEKYKKHPAILLWGLGNEMEGPANKEENKLVLREVNELAKIVKKEDPDHPVMTVIAGLGSSKAAQIEKYCPEIDLLGINAYAGAKTVAAELAAQGWKKPFMLTEFGPFGHWEVRKTSWGAPIEPNSQEKADSYLAAHERAVEEGKGQCLGTFAFYWGEKQECTATWFGMFLSTGERLGTVDAMSYAWSGNFPKNRSPQLHSLESTAALERIAPQSKQTARVVADDPDGDKLRYEWVVVAESTDQKIGGDRESRPPSFPELIQSQNENKVSFTAPTKSGAYRLFVYVTDNNKNAATANFPFYVN